MHAQGFDVELRQLGDHWRANFYATRMAHSVVDASGWEPTPWRAVRRAATSLIRLVRSQSPLLHILSISFVSPNASSENIVSQREHNIEVPVLVSVVQAVISCQKLIDRPGAEGPLLRLVHLQMNFVPRPVMKNHNGHKDRRPLPGYQCNERSKWNRLDRRLPHSQPYLLIFTTSDRFIAESLGVVPVMQKSVRLKYALEGRSMRTEEVLSVHQLPVDLVLDKGHQNTRENEPATDLQNKHQRWLASPVLIVVIQAG